MYLLNASAYQSKPGGVSLPPRLGRREAFASNPACGDAPGCYLQRARIWHLLDSLQRYCITAAGCGAHARRAAAIDQQQSRTTQSAQPHANPVTVDICSILVLPKSPMADEASTARCASRLRPVEKPPAAHVRGGTRARWSRLASLGGGLETCSSSRRPKQQRGGFDRLRHPRPLATWNRRVQLRFQSIEDWSRLAQRPTHVTAQQRHSAPGCACDPTLILARRHTRAQPPAIDASQQPALSSARNHCLHHILVATWPTAGRPVLRRLSGGPRRLSRRAGLGPSRDLRPWAQQARPPQPPPLLCSRPP